MRQISEMLVRLVENYIDDVEYEEGQYKLDMDGIKFSARICKEHIMILWSVEDVEAPIAYVYKDETPDEYQALVELFETGEVK